MNEAIAIDEREFAPDHPNLASDLGALAQLYQVQGRFDEAEPRCKRALDISERTGDPASIGRDLNNLAWLYQGQGRYAEAEPLVTRSLDLIEKSLGTKADYGRALDTLAKIHEGQGRVSEAEKSLSPRPGDPRSFAWRRARERGGYARKSWRTVEVARPAR